VFVTPCACLLATILLARGQEPSEWPTYHGRATLDGVADAAPPDNPVRLWRFKAGRGIEATPVSTGGRIFVTAAKGLLIALDLEGRQAWKTDIAKDSFSAPPMCADQAVIVGSRNGVLYAFDAATGREKWSRKMEDPLQGSANRVDLPCGRKGIVALSSADGSLHCVDLDSGEALWKTGPLERCDGSPGVGSGRIVIGSCASALHVFSIEKAVKEADIYLGGDDQVAGGVALSGKMAFAGTRSGKVVAVDVVDHKILWSNSDSRGEAFATPAVNDRFVVFASDDGKVYGLNRETGVRLWDFDTGFKPLSPVIAGTRVVVSSGGSLFLLELETGRKLWTVRVSDEITSPAVVGGRVIVGADDGTVTAFGREQK
jgi:outer membrane protein assembly factor BamB